MEAHDQPTAEWQPDVPWNALPRLTTTTLELETKLVLKHCIEARAALAELKQAAELLPNQSMLINLLPVLEARDSSKIENIVTTTDELFRFIDRRRSNKRSTEISYSTMGRVSFTRCPPPINDHSD
jgi:Fic family protein